MQSSPECGILVSKANRIHRYTQTNKVSIFWLCVQNVTILSLFLTISYKSFIVDNGHTSEPSDCLILRQLPQANISPPLSTNVCICSVTLNLSVSRDSHSTPLPSKNTFISSPSFNAKFANRNAFQTVSESFEYTTIPILMFIPTSVRKLQ